MNAKADWIVVAGFLLALFGVALRIIIMMRSSDARATNLTPLAGGNLVRAYRAAPAGIETSCVGVRVWLCRRHSQWSI